MYPQFPRMTKPAAGARPWFEIKAAAGDGPAEVRIYDSIGWWGVTAKDFAAELDAISADEIVLRINSSGGDVFDGFAIYNLLRDHPAKVTTIVDGFAASIASIIALAGDTIQVHEASVVMIHDPWGVGIGNATELRELADVLDKTIAAPMAKLYSDRMDTPIAEIRNLMEAETWYTGEEAVEAGFASELITSAPPEEDGAKASARDLSGFRNPPAELAGDDDPLAPNGDDDESSSDDAELVGLMKRRLAVQELDE
jgi:ATP-dependent protease ClpP protease subunit